MAEKKPHVSKEKKEIVQRFTKLINEYKVIAAVDVENLPAKQLNNMRSQLREDALLIMTKRRLMNIVLDASDKKDIAKLKPYLKGMPTLLFSNANPFKLYKILKKNKSPAPIKTGQTAPSDIVVPAGPTSFAPGPIIGDLGALGIPAGIDGGKVAIKADSVVAKEGDVISEKLAAILLRLEIYPLEIGLNLVAAYENGEILLKKDLDIDEDAFMTSLQKAALDAFTLTMELGIITSDNITPLVQKAHRDAYSLADSQSIMTSDNVNTMLAKANAQAEALKSKVE